MKRPSLLNTYITLTFFLFSFGVLSQIQNKESSEFRSSKSTNSFIENKGQIVDQDGNFNHAVAYLLNTPGLNVQLKDNGFSYDLYEREYSDKVTSKKKPKQTYKTHLDSTLNENSKTKFHRLEFEFLDINPNLKIVPYDEASYTLNYYNVIYRPEGITGVKNFKKVIYKNLYSNIDLEFFVPLDINKPVEYNFVIHPGGKITDIKMQVLGAKVNYRKNFLEIETEFGVLKEVIPLSWTQKEEQIKEVKIEYQKLGENIFGFASESDLANNSIITIDPTPIRVWGTYFGGDYTDTARSKSATGDSQGNTIHAGYTLSVDNIATIGSHQYDNFIYDNIQPRSAGMLMKFDEDGMLLWATYYGGVKETRFLNVETDIDDNIIGVGYTFSETHISTSGSYQENKSGSTDGFVVKFNEAGVRLWGSYYGSSESDGLNTVTTDSNKNIYVGGGTGSSDNIATNGAYDINLGQNIYSYSFDGFLVKLDENGSREWATYYGGLRHDNIVDIETDAFDNILILGNTESEGAIATVGAFKENLTPNGPQTQDRDDAFLVKFNPLGQRIWGTYFGGDAIDWAFSIAVDTNNDVIISGVTQSTIEITHNNSHQPLKGGNIADWDNFLAKFSNGGDMMWSTYYGGDEWEDYTHSAVDTDNANNVYLAGGTGSQNNISTINAYQENLGSLTNAFLVKFDKLGNRQWGTYYGAGHTTTTGLYLGNNSIYLAGETTSHTEIATSGAHQTLLNSSNNGNNSHSDYFVVKFKECLGSVTATIDENVCEGDNITMEALGGASYLWSGPNGFSSSTSNGVINNATVLNSGQYKLIIQSVEGCTEERVFEVVVSAVPIIGIVDDLVSCEDYDARGYSAMFDTSNVETQAINGQSNVVVSYYNSNGDTLPNPLPNLMTNSIANQETITVRISNRDNLDCYSETSFNLIVNELPLINLEDDYFICNLDPSITISVNQGYDLYDWQFEDGSTISNTNIATLVNEGDYTIVVAKIENGITCEDSFSFHLTRSVLPVIERVNYDELGNNFIEIIASGDGDFEYSIDGVNYQDSNYFDNISGGTYNVFVRDREGCGEDTEEITLIDYPKYFTPNNDSYHDYWHIYGINEYPNSVVYIFDRYGKLLKQLNSQSLGWDGTYNGELLTGTDYWFTADLGNGKTFKGHFALKK